MRLCEERLQFQQWNLTHKWDNPRAGILVQLQEQGAVASLVKA
jgi:hypothetical protein